MSGYNYSTKIGENEASAVGLALPISTKQTISICDYIRGKKLERAKKMLTDAIDEIIPVPMPRYTDGVGHRKGNLTSGRFPKKACTEIIKLLNSAQANAQFKGLSSAGIIIRHISAQKGSNTFRQGRRRRFAKRTTVEVVLAEMVEKKAESKKTTPTIEAKKEATNVETDSPKEKKVEAKIEQSSNSPNPKDLAKKETPKVKVTKPKETKKESQSPNKEEEKTEQ